MQRTLENPAKMKKLVLVLGAPNDDKGNLSNIALDRLNCAYDFYQFNDDVNILCTGGFGNRFNTTDKPHAHYAHSFLMDKSIPQSNLAEYILSSNTVDDFRKSKDLILSLNPSLLIIITSDFHMKRAKLLHNILLNYPNTLFIPAKSSLSEKELKPLIEHEEKAITELERNNYHIY